MVGGLPNDRLEEILSLTGFMLQRDPDIHADQPSFHRGLTEQDIRFLVQAFNLNMEFRPRDVAETDDGFKQVIPYVIISRTIPRPGWELFYVDRQGGDERLVGERSLGIGGHIHPDDYPPFIEMTMLREIKEEVDIRPDPDLRRRNTLLSPRGLIVGGQGVSRYHIGIVFRFHVHESVEIVVRETDTLSGGWDFIPADFDPEKALSKYEPWSKAWFRERFLT